jgi:hypothetical protein
VVTHCTFNENHAEIDGAGLYGTNSSLILSNCIFSRNHGGYFGGGIYCVNGSPKITNNTFLNNSAHWGGGIFRGTGTATITGNVFTGNNADYGGGICCRYGASAMISNCTISGNTAGEGAGILSDSSITTITNNIIVGNSTSHCGGGISCYDSATITNNVIADNHSRYEGGGIYCGGIELRPAVTNCILWGNTTEESTEEAKQIYGSYPNYSCIEDWKITFCGIGNIDTDPCFVNPGYWADPWNTPGYHWDDFWVDGDYHLKSQAGHWDANEGRWTRDEVTSLCIDAGDPTSPIGFEPFPNGGIINMGDYGGTEEASKSYFGEPVCETIIAGDINGDCIIDFKDFTLMALHWLECIGPNQGGWHLIEDDTEDSYSCEGNFDIFYPCSNAVDEDWDTYALPADLGATSYIYETYIIPSGIAMADFRIKYQQTAPVTPGLCTTVTDYWDGSTWTELNCTALSNQISTLTVRIPHDALSRTTLQLRTRVWKSSGLIGSGSGMYYEGKVIWYFLPVCETIVAGDINGDCKVDFKDFALMAFHWLEEH